MIITTFLLFRQQGFNSSTLLRSLSYSVALSIRQAQVYGVSVRESGIGTGVFAQGYGVQFSNNGCGLGNTNRYQLFSDVDNDGQLDSGEELPCFTVGNGRGTDYKIKDFCAVDSGGTASCLSASAITSLAVYFRRPNPDACFQTSAFPAACAQGAMPRYSYAYIQLQSQGGTDIRTVKVNTSGQITVCKLNVSDISTC